MLNTLVYMASIHEGLQWVMFVTTVEYGPLQTLPIEILTLWVVDVRKIG